MISLQHLQHAVAVSQEMCFSAAARRLGIAQPALSQSIRTLERSLGVTLFVRDSRHVSLTEAGKVFCEEALQCLQQVNHAACSAKLAERSRSDSVTIVYTATSMAGGLPDVLARFHARYPEVALRLTEIQLGSVVGKVASGEVDVGCTAWAMIDASLDSIPIRRDGFVLALHHSHRLAGEAVIPLAALATETFILPSAFGGQSRANEKIMAMCRESGFSPRCEYIVENMPSTVGLVAANLGIAFVFDAPSLLRDGVIFRPFTPNSCQETINLIWKKGNASPNLARLIDCVSSPPRG
ncbi:LysR substrate-binding domain-containing protein [Telmatospirillum sp.]|uniref:LysR family transcriptional regulator n=1 Tax=Telmatospirillum sp. TaxID=2079197 RepID=UPI00285190F0|nr:LysR substrate-binding domain-containing protein [Telmatospirillum sp.]MDR3437560.1 LysR substrate-binding domain-containing protein [Telmatospirillum sp.]